MKSKLAFIIGMAITIAPAGLTGQNVGFHITTPQHPVDIRQPETIDLEDFDPVLHVKYSGSNAAQVIAVKGESTPAESRGIGGYFVGGILGVLGQVESGGAATYQGVTGYVFGSGTGTYRAVGGNAEGSSGIKQGIYGSAGGGGINWAGYFDEGDVYIKNRLGIGESAPAARLHITDGALLAEGATGNTPVSGEGRRMMWIPAKAAFRAGEVSGPQWNADSIGLYSAAFGQNPNATGQSSFVGCGTSNTASGARAFVGGGQNNIASEQMTFVGGGQSNTASSFWAFAGGGQNNTASGAGAFAGGGQNNIASGLRAFVGGGSNNTASSAGAFVGGGADNAATGNNAFATGIGSSAVSFGETVVGTYCTLYSPLNTAAYNSSDRVFVVGNGANAGAPSNALTVMKNGRTGLGLIPATNRLEVDGNASKSTAGDWLANSDMRLKKNILLLDSEEMLSKLLSLRGITYEWNDDKTGSTRPEGIHYGFTAQNIQEVFPSLVEEDALGYLQTAYGTYDAMMVEALRALQAQIHELQSENTMLRTSIEAFEAKGSQQTVQEQITALQSENMMLMSSLQAFEEKFEAFVAGTMITRSGQ